MELWGSCAFHEGLRGHTGLYYFVEAFPLNVCLWFPLTDESFHFHPPLLHLVSLLLNTPSFPSFPPAPTSPAQRSDYLFKLLLVSGRSCKCCAMFNRCRIAPSISKLTDSSVWVHADRRQRRGKVLPSVAVCGKLPLNPFKCARTFSQSTYFEPRY